MPDLPLLPAPRRRGRLNHANPPPVLYLPAHCAQLTQMTVKGYPAGPGQAVLVTARGIVYLPDERLSA